MRNDIINCSIIKPINVPRYKTDNVDLFLDINTHSDLFTLVMKLPDKQTSTHQFDFKSSDEAADTYRKLQQLIEHIEATISPDFKAKSIMLTQLDELTNYSLTQQ
jgi:acyl carrier protein